MPAEDEAPLLRERKEWYGGGVAPGAGAGAGAGGGNGAVGRHVVFCVHGKPGGGGPGAGAGCCALVLDARLDRDHEGQHHLVEEGKAGEGSEGGAHCHRARSGPRIDTRARRKLIIASVLCVIFMVAEIVGGYLSSSLAIATDAAHLLTDFAGFMISLGALWVSGRAPSARMSFGWHRAEVLGALVSVLLIWLVTAVLVYLAVLRLIYRDFSIDATVMLITSALGVLVNLIMGLTLHDFGHAHGGGGGTHAHGHAHAHNTGAQNINVRAAFIHVLGDFLQSFGVLVAAIVIYFKPSWSLVDPVCTFLFSVLVMATTFGIVRDALLVLMEAAPAHLDSSEVARTLAQLPGVVRVHSLRVWALSPDKTALAAHLAVSEEQAGTAAAQHSLLQAARSVVDQYDVFESTLQLEPYEPSMDTCGQCQLP